MRRIIIALVCLLSCMICLSGCDDPILCPDSYETKNCHMIIVEGLGNTAIYMHKETGVLYFHNDNRGGFCPMIKADGTAYTIEDFNADRIKNEQ